MGREGRAKTARPPAKDTRSGLPAAVLVQAATSVSTSKENRHFRYSCGHDSSMAGAELRAALEQRLGELAIRTEVVEHPEVRRSSRDSPAEGGGLHCSVSGEAAKTTCPRDNVPRKRPF